jgi:outer membrane protease
VPRSRRFPIPTVALAAALVALAPDPVQAIHTAGQPEPGSLKMTGEGVAFSFGASAVLVEGSATELAIFYPNGRKFKLSELAWDLKDVVMAGVHGSVGVGRRFRANFGVWSALTEGDGTMVDRDWNYPDSQSALLEPNDRNWTDESRHPDTSVVKGTILDLNLNVLALQAGPFSFRGIVGYKNDTWGWTARGGTYVYSQEFPGSRDAVGTFPEGQEVITYRQQYSIPYVGVGASWGKRAVQLESHVLYSPLVTARDTDYHVLRGVLFEGDFNGGTYLGLGLSASWAFTPQWSAALGVEYQSIPEINGDVRISGDEAGGFFAGGGGIAMSATSVTLGAGYRF